MKVENKFIKLRCFWLYKCLLILSIIVLNTSCEKENNNTKLICSFLDYHFIDNVKCYNTIGNSYDSLSYIYSQDDFVFPVEFEQPYDKIEINTDNTVIMYYTRADTTKIRNEIVIEINDTLYFYNESDIKNTLFKGLIVDHQLIIPGYGCRYNTFVGDSNNQIEIKKTTVGLGIPDLEDLLSNFPMLYYNNYPIKKQNMYFQRFDLIYDIKNE